MKNSFIQLLLPVIIFTSLTFYPIQGQSIISFRGLSHEAIGEAILNNSGDTTLTVSNIGTSGEDGVIVDLGETLGGIPQFLLSQNGILPEGTVYVNQATGIIDGLPNQPLGSLTIEGLNDKMMLTPDFNNIGAPTYKLQLLLNGSVVHSISGMSGAAVIVGVSNKASKACCRVILYSATFGIANPTPVDVVGGPTIMADNILFFPENPTANVEAVTSLKATGIGLNEFVVKNYQVAIFDPFLEHHILGSDFLFANLNKITAFDSNEDNNKGISVDLHDINSIEIMLDPVNLETSSSDFTFSATGNFGSFLNSFLGQIKLTNESGGEGLILTGNLNPLISDKIEIEVFNNGDSQGSTILESGNLGSLEGTVSIHSCGTFSSEAHGFPTSRPGFFFQLEKANTFTASDQTQFIGSRFIISAVDPNNVVDDLSTIDLNLSNENDSLTIINEIINDFPVSIKNPLFSIFSNFKIHPNPSQNEIVIHFEPEILSSVEQMLIIDLFGRRIKKVDLNTSGKVYVDISDYKNGTYFIVAKGLTIGKFIKL